MNENNRILFVDDENQILHALRRALIDEGFEMHFAASGAEALAILETKEMAVIVADMRMPGMDGLTLLKEVKRRWPLTVRMVLSGYAQMQQIIATVNNVDVFRYLLKPWKLDDGFVEALHQAVEYHNLLKDKELRQISLEKKNATYQGIIRITDESLKRHQEVIRFLTELNKVMWRTVKDNLEQGVFDVEMAGVMEGFANSIYGGFLADSGRFSPQELLVGLRDQLVKTHSLEKEKISIVETNKSYFLGHSPLFAVLLSCAISAAMLRRKVSAIFMEWQLGESDAAEFHLAFLVEMAMPGEEPIALLQDGKIPYRQIEIILGSVAKFLGGNIVILQHQAAVVIRLEVAVKKTSE